MLFEYFNRVPSMIDIKEPSARGLTDYIHCTDFVAWSSFASSRDRGSLSTNVDGRFCFVLIIPQGST